MKVTGVIVALVAAAPMATAIPFRISDIIAPVAARAPEPAPVAVPEPVQEGTKQVFPQYRSLNITTRDVNVTARAFNATTLVDKRSFIPEGIAPRNVTKA